VESQSVCLACGSLRRCHVLSQIPRYIRAWPSRFNSSQNPYNSHAASYLFSYSDMSANAIVYMPVYAQTGTAITPAIPLVTTYMVPLPTSSRRKRLWSSTKSAQLYVPVLIPEACVVVFLLWRSLSLLDALQYPVVTMLPPILLMPQQ
jgi:hypothetical protein